MWAKIGEKRNKCDCVWGNKGVRDIVTQKVEDWAVFTNRTTRFEKPEKPQIFYTPFSCSYNFYRTFAFKSFRQCLNGVSTKSYKIMIYSFAAICTIP